jgi:uncharacterized tellurite resistance protein B-like protein
MIKSLKALFEHPEKKNSATKEHDLHLAAAALLVETARADFDEDSIELESLGRLLSTTLKISAEEVKSLIPTAQERVEKATSLYEHTRVINQHCSAEQKIKLIAAMWKVAYADGNLDKYEEHLIRQVADLAFVPHSDYIKCKLAARN